MVKTLTRVGNSRALIIDRTLLDLLHLGESEEVEIEVHGDAMVVRAAGRPEQMEGRRTRLREASDALMDRFAEAHRRLAQ